MLGVGGSEAEQGLGHLDGGSAAEQVLGIGLELVQGRQELIAAEQLDRRRQGGAIDRVAAQQGPQLHHRHLIPGPVPGIGGVCVVGAEGGVLPAVGSRGLGRCRPATVGRAGGATAAGGGGTTATGRPGGSAAGFNAEQALELGQLLKQGADRLQQGAAAGSGRGSGLGDGGVHGVAARGRGRRRGVDAAGGGRNRAIHQTITW